MARKKNAHAEHENHERWLVSYADFITLLFAFFVVMFASSQTDKSKAQAVSNSVKEALEKGGVPALVHEVLGGTVDDKGQGNAMMKGPGGTSTKNVKETPPPQRDTKTPLEELAPSMTYLSKELQQEIKDGKVEVHMEARGLVISLKQYTFFPSGEDAIDPKTYNIVDKVGKVILDNKSPVRLEGHTDSQPIHTDRFPSNWQLSAARAYAMLDLLVARCHVPQNRLCIGAYADTVPADTNDTPEGRMHNRRVDVVILSQETARDTAAAEPVKKEIPAKTAAGKK
ncbi:MAG TPA: flagellar motor protein MotB [Verrucomicrobiae bacterium]|nr:flagellar motor protein MotB [Verrucomicrobiae bacterium]